MVVPIKNNLQQTPELNIDANYAFFNLLPVAVYVCDKDGKITYFNKAAADLWGRDPELGIDHYCGSFKIFDLNDSPLPAEQYPITICLREQKAVYGIQIKILRPDGTEKFVAPYPQPLFDANGNLSGAINMLIDLSELKHKEIALRESEEKYNNLSQLLETEIAQNILELQRKAEELQRNEDLYHKMIEEVEDYAILLLDKNGIIQNWNKGAQKIKGYKEEEIVGKSFEHFYFEEDRNNKLPHRLLQEAREKGKVIHEGFRRRKDGSKFWGSIVLTSLHDNDNNIIGFTKVTRDLTERKASEDKLKEYTSQLEFQNQELEQFAYVASHDMKEPLRKIHMYNGYVLENEENVLSDKSKDFMGRSLKAVKRMANLIDDLLSYSRTTSIVGTFEEVDLNDILESIQLANKEEFKNTNIILTYNNLPVVNGIMFQLEQLFDNIINNSIKYKHPARDVEIVITSKKVSLKEPLNNVSDKLKDFYQISVADNGIGFDVQNSAKIFELFQRLTNSKASGTGIGLSICKRIMQNHSGFINAEGKVNEGATFNLFFPVDASSSNKSIIGTEK